VPTPLTALPATLIAGDSYAITLSLSDYPAPTWALSLSLAGLSVLSVTSTANGTAHDLTLTAVQTAALEAGSYQFRLRANAGSTVTTVQSGVLSVTADVGALAPGEGVSYWETLKAAAESALLTLMQGGGVQMATILGRQTMFRSPADCQRVIAQCEARILAARARTFGTPIRFDVVGMR
jgi:hypothetical protein